VKKDVILIKKFVKLVHVYFAKRKKVDAKKCPLASKKSEKDHPMNAKKSVIVEKELALLPRQACAHKS
jgi:hypothetical protein